MVALSIASVSSLTFPNTLLTGNIRMRRKSNKYRRWRLTKLMKRLVKTILRKRKQLIEALRNKVDNKHNKSVLDAGAGEILLGRRPQGFEDEKFNVAEYGPCPTCLEWLRLSGLQRHQATCTNKAKDFQSNKTMLIMQSFVITGRTSEEASKTMTQEVFPIMRLDLTGRTARNDKLIVALGNQMLLRNASNPLMRKYYASQAMRLVAIFAVLVFTSHFSDKKYQKIGGLTTKWSENKHLSMFHWNNWYTFLSKAIQVFN